MSRQKERTGHFLLDTDHTIKELKVLMHVHLYVFMYVYTASLSLSLSLPPLPLFQHYYLECILILEHHVYSLLEGIGNWSAINHIIDSLALTLLLHCVGRV